MVLAPAPGLGCFDGRGRQEFSSECPEVVPELVVVGAILAAHTHPARYGTCQLGVRHLDQTLWDICSRGDR